MELDCALDRVAIAVPGVAEASWQIDIPNIGVHRDSEDWLGGGRVRLWYLYCRDGWPLAHQNCPGKTTPTCERHDKVHVHMCVWVRARVRVCVH